MKITISMVYGLLLPCTAVYGAEFMQGHISGAGSELLVANGGAGSVLIVDSVATGGNDISANNGEIQRAFVVENVWSPGSSVELSGIALPIWANAPDSSLNSNTRNGVLTIHLYGLGNDGVFSGTEAEALIGSAPVTFSSANSGVDAFHANFDAPVTFTAESNGVAIVLSHSAAIRLKEGPGGSGVRQVRRSDGGDFPIFSQ